jgi:TldD protein
MNRRATLLAAMCLTCLPALTPAAPPDDSTGRPQDTLLLAMRAEVDRAASGLRLGDLERPYYLDAEVTDQTTVEMTASFGALLASTRSHVRPLRVSARIGSFAQDSSEFFAAKRSLFHHQAPSSLATDDEQLAMRRDLWLALDAAYKDALEHLATKRAAFQNRIVKEPVPDFSPVQPVISLAPRLALEAHVEGWEDELRRLSAVLREFPGLERSEVSLRVVAANRYFVSSEGSAVRQPYQRAMLVVRASTRAADGMVVRSYRPLFAATVSGLPPERELTELVRSVAGEVSALAQAPLLDDYVGPVLFSGQAAGELVAQVLAPELSGHRPPMFDTEALAGMLPHGELAERLNRMVLPAFLSVTDDPTSTSFDGQTLIGGYAFDDQGVAARRLPVVADGRLRTLLMSRRPRKQITISNGHGRAEPFGAITAHASNLIVTSKDGLSPDRLRRKLLDLARDAGLEYALVVRRIEDGGVLSGGDAGHGLEGSSRGLGNGLADPVLVYRVRVADGREELVRGVNLSGVGVRTLREIAAAGTDSFVDNRFVTFTGNMFASYDGPATDPGVPTSVVTPSLLLPDVEASSQEGDQQRPALLPNPYFELRKGR